MYGVGCAWSCALVCRMLSRDAVDRSKRWRMRAAFCSCSLVLAMPRASIASAVSGRRPAVSTSLKLMLPMLSLSSMRSRVVPGVSETMARSSFSSAFSSVDLPALGLPAITVCTPLLTALPSAKPCTSGSMCASKSWSRALRAALSAKAMSSSAKSSSSSSMAAKWSSLARSAWMWAENWPRIWCMAMRWAAAESAAIRSATASAWARSNLPCRKARCVNSPGCASCTPWRTRSCTSCCTT